GTHSVLVAERFGAEPFLLSCNHVFAGSNTARIGDPIVQPALDDGGSLFRDTVARLSRYVPIRFDGEPNRIDAALASVAGDVARPGLAYLGGLEGVCPQSELRIGARVHKLGRTTGLTTGVVEGIDASVKVVAGQVVVTAGLHGRSPGLALRSGFEV